MTALQFQIFWSSNYPETIPVPHYFKYCYHERWFRIHSLPESKRYADNTAEWEILLARQNEIITDILGENKKVLLVIGDYSFKDSGEVHIVEEVASLKPYRFTRLTDIDLYELQPENYSEGQVYRPALAKTIWRSHQHDNLLRDIADDNFRAFFISPENNAIAAPYDGGIDFVVRDKPAKDLFRQTYACWLSMREDGL